MTILSIVTIAIIYAFGGVGLYAIFLHNFTKNMFYRYLGASFWPLTIILIGWVLMLFMFVQETEL